MTPTIPVRLNALARDVQAFQARIDRVAAALPEPGRRDPDSLAKVMPLYKAAAALQARAGALSTSLGLGGADFFDGPQSDAKRGVAAVLNSAWFSDRTITQRTRTGEHSHAPTTTSVNPNSGVSEQNWLRAAGGKDLPNVRLSGSVPQPAANLVADRLENVPAPIIDLTDELGDRGILFSGKLTDVHGYKSLRGVQPRGWPKGSTWDQVPGAARHVQWAGNASREDRGKGHGSTSLSLHEYGHTVDHAIASPIWTRASRSAEWQRNAQREVRQREAPKPYLKNYSEEWFAEAFARYTKSPQSTAALARWYPETYDFFREHVGKPDFR